MEEALKLKKPFSVAQVLPEVALIGDEALRNKVISIWEQLYEMSEWNDVMEVPVSGRMPERAHIPHNRSVVMMAVKVADVFEEIHGVKVDRDHLIAAGLLQDSSKLVEYAPDGEGGVKKTELGKAYPHSFYAAHLAAAEGLPMDVVQAIITHSPGSAKFPPTLIGKILFYVDQLDMSALGDQKWEKVLYLKK